MQLPCQQSRAPSIHLTDNPVKDRLALSALCNNSSENPPYFSHSTPQTSSSISSLTTNAVSLPSFPEATPNFSRNPRLPPISDLKLFSQPERPSLETLLTRNTSHSDGIPTPIDSSIPHRSIYYEKHSPARNITRRESNMASAYMPYKLPSNVPSFPPSPPAFSPSSCAQGVLTNSPLPDLKSHTFTRHKWSQVGDSPLSRSRSSSFSASPANSSYTRRKYPSQNMARVCTNCGISQTRQWVRGENHAWLCHSCGQFWRKNGYSRPRALWNRPTFKRSSRKSKLTNHGVEDSKRAKCSTTQTVSSSFLDGKKMIQLETCLPHLHRGSVAHTVVNVRDGLTTR